MFKEKGTLRKLKLKRMMLSDRDSRIEKDRISDTLLCFIIILHMKFEVWFKFCLIFSFLSDSLLDSSQFSLITYYMLFCKELLVYPLIDYFFRLFGFCEGKLLMIIKNLSLRGTMCVVLLFSLKCLSFLSYDKIRKINKVYFLS